MGVALEDVQTRSLQSYRVTCQKESEAPQRAGQTRHLQVSHVGRRPDLSNEEGQLRMPSVTFI